MRIADRLLLKGVKVSDIRLWKSSQNEQLTRVGREAHFPPRTLDCLDPYLLLAHQGFVEDLLLKDIMERGVDVQRNVTFVDYLGQNGPDKTIEVVCKRTQSEAKQVFATSYVVGCDGARSNVRKSMGVKMIGSSYDQIWGVLDGELETDFPDMFSKTVVHSEEAGSMIILPRERGMTRLYIELKPEMRDVASREELSQDFVMDIAREILEVRICE
jgi:phenol 2-monooxygenase